MLFALDVETPSACEQDHYGSPLVPQTSFHPTRCLIADGYSTSQLVLSTAITLPLIPTDSPDSLSQIKPGETMVFVNQCQTHHNRLVKWLSKATYIVGHNVSYDILWLRAAHPDYARLLTPNRLRLIDTGILNFLEDEDREERSLKDLVHLFGIFKYTRTLKDGRFLSPNDPEHQKYNASDTHATLLLLAELAGRIQKRYGPNTPKLCEDSIHHFSDVLWTSIRMAEAGLPMSRSSLIALEKAYSIHRDYCRHTTKARFQLLLGNFDGNTGCQATQNDFVRGIIVTTTPPTMGAPHPILDHNCLEKSKHGKISWTKLNRDLFRTSLPPNDPRREALLLANEEATSAKMVSSFTCKLLRHRSNHPSDQKDRLWPQSSLVGGDHNLDTHLAYPSIRIVPSPSKDDSDDDKGQRQGRPSWTCPPAQTFPEPIRKYQSRWHGGIILCCDMSQHELRTAAMLSGDEVLVKVYEDGIDLHTQTAQAIFGASIVDHPRFHEFHRQAAKHSNFEMLNWGGPDTLQHTILNKSGFLYPIEDCRRMVRSRSKVYPQLVRWQNQLVRKAHAEGYIHLPITGHSRCYLGEKDATKIVNFPIQCIAALTVWEIINYFCRHTLPCINDPHPFALPFLNHYDAGLFDCRNEAAATQVRSGFQDAIDYVQNSGYWHRLCEHYGTFVPIEGSFKELTL